MIKIVFTFSFLLLFSTNIYPQSTNIIQVEKIKRLIGSTDLETIFYIGGYLYANSVYLNLLHENELKKKISILYGVEYQKAVSKVIINGQLSSVFVSHYYFLKTKSHYYVLPFNKQKHSSLNGLYIGPSFKIGASITDNYRNYKISPGILVGSCFVVSNKLTLNIEFDYDGYFSWSKRLDRDDEYNYSSSEWMNLWFSVGYRF
jgi:hypothetical protein